MKQHPGLCILALVWLVPALGSGLALWGLPDAVLGTRDAGAFMSATSAPGGLFSEPLTTVQASQGTWVVNGAVSVTRGQRLLVVDSTKDGLQLCAFMPAKHCMPLAGDFVGGMQANSKAPFQLSNHAWELWSGIAAIWFAFGGIAFALGAAFTSDEAKRAAAQGE